MTKSTAAPTLEKITEQFDAFHDDLRIIEKEVQKFILGQRDVIRLSLTTLLSGGHAVLIGLPGLGKTRLVQTLSQVMGLDTKRIQCTPDLMPADILGSEILQQDQEGQRHFRFLEGPVFCQLLMADEINRASPRTQSALLEAMQERRVTIAGHSRDLPRPFHVLATQNPLEQEGTYPLPEAQRDRFLMQIDITYPDLDEERAMVLATTAGIESTPKKLFSSDRLLTLQALICDMPIGDDVLKFALKLVRALRPDDQATKDVREFIEWGPGPRASQALIQTAKAYALLDGRTTPAVEDIKTLALPVLKHRMAVTLSARAQGISIDDLILKTSKSLK